MILTKWEYTLFKNYYIDHIVPYNLSQSMKFLYNMNNFKLVCTYKVVRKFDVHMSSKDVMRYWNLKDWLELYETLW
jgi:hypothetical protein